jgi:sigma-B regulation protein RsbU (phosphoserine phosphatase)
MYDDLTRADLFITMFCCRFEPQTRVLKFANGGHNPPLLLRAEAVVCAELDGDGMVLGAKRRVDYEERALSLHPGDRVLLYTDGVTEAQSPTGEFFGVSRLCESFRAHRRQTPEAILPALLGEVRSFCADAPLTDDVAIVVLEIR